MEKAKVFGWDTDALDVVENVDLNNYRIIVTGGASGIGVETARALAKTGAEVIITARDMVKAQEVADDIIETTGNKRVHIDHLELDSLSSVELFVQRFLETKRSLNILINNAGVMACPLSYTKDGFEMQFGTNHVGHFALTLGLIPALKKGAQESGKNSRVVNVSSGAHRFSDIVYDDINYKTRPYHDFASYGQSKTANILFSVELSRRYASEGILSNALMPGIIWTNLQRHLDIETMKKQGKLDENGKFKTGREKTIQQGASTSVWAAVAPELENMSGVYLEDCEIGETRTKDDVNMQVSKGCMYFALDSENAKKLWLVTEKMIAECTNKS